MDKNKTLYRIFIHLYKLAIELADGCDATITGIEMRPMGDKTFPGEIEITFVASNQSTHKIKATYSCESKGEADV